jgi:glycosyltransferase involved in cell wall biosynthesis
MKISIVTISFNQGRFLREAIASIVEQRYEALEYVVVDPGSTDESRAIIQKYSPKIDKIILEPDQGAADGLNRGFAVATGEIFGYINADDVLLPGALHCVADAFERNPSVDVIFGDAIQLSESGNVVQRLRSTFWNKYLYAIGGSTVLQQATFFRAASFRNSGGFNIDNRTCWDGELLVDLDLSGAKFKQIDAVLGGFRIYGTSISGSGNHAEKCRPDHQRIFEKVYKRRETTLDRTVGQSIGRLAKTMLNPRYTASRLNAAVKRLYAKH